MNKTKKEILKNLENTYCRLRPSKIKGVGVFAIRDIPKGINPFCGVQKRKWQTVKMSDLKCLDKSTTKMVNDFYGINGKDEFILADCGLNGMDISFFMNTSKIPNIGTIDGGENFFSIRKIKKGEELTVSYAKYDARYR